MSLDKLALETSLRYRTTNIFQLTIAAARPIPCAAADSRMIFPSSRPILLTCADRRCHKILNKNMSQQHSLGNRCKCIPKLDMTSHLFLTNYKLISFLDSNKFHTKPWPWCLLWIAFGIFRHSRLPAPARQEGGGKEALSCLSSLASSALRELLSMLGASSREPLGGSPLFNLEQPKSKT